jgi:hypothetical protein
VRRWADDPDLRSLKGSKSVTLEIADKSGIDQLGGKYGPLRTMELAEIFLAK